MKKVKMFSAVLAIAIALIGSAFTKTSAEAWKLVSKQQNADGSITYVVDRVSAIDQANLDYNCGLSGLACDIPSYDLTGMNASYISSGFPVSVSDSHANTAPDARFEFTVPVSGNFPIENSTNVQYTIN